MKNPGNAVVKSMEKPRRCKDALGSTLNYAVNNLWLAGYPNMQMLASRLLYDKQSLAGMTGAIICLGAFLELLDELT